MELEAYESLRAEREQEEYEQREQEKEWRDDESVASVWGTIHEKTDELKQMCDYTEQEWKHYWDAKYGV